MSLIYQRVADHLENLGVDFDVIEHRPVATAAEYSEVVGSPISQQAKALLIRRTRAGGGKDFVIVSVPGDRQADLAALCGVLDARKLRLATRDELRASTGCSFGELPAIGSIFELPLYIDVRLLAHESVFIGAGLDHSITINPRDWMTAENATTFTPGGPNDA